MVNGHGPGPAPAAHARASAIPATWSRWRAEPQENERRNVPRVDGAATRWPSTCPVAPARKASASPIHSPPARAEGSRVMALSPALAAPGASPRSRWVSNSSRSRSPSARLAARIRPASATAWSSSKVTVSWSGLWDDRTEQVSSWLGRTVASATPFSQVSGHLFATSRGQNQQILGGSRLNQQAKQQLAAGRPVISVDTKKKELVGRYAN